MGAFWVMYNKARLEYLVFFEVKKSNLHKSTLNDFEKIADNFFIIQHLLNYGFLQRNSNLHEMPTGLHTAPDYNDNFINHMY